MRKYLFVAISIVLMFNFLAAGFKTLGEYLQPTQPLSAKETFRPSNMLRLDKLKHFTFSLYLTTTSYYISNRIAGLNRSDAQYLSTGLTISLGIGKESHDRWWQNEVFSFPDIVADIAGTALGLLIINRIDNG